MAPGSARGRMRRLPRVKHHLQGSVTAEPSSDVFIGVDLGTSGVRALATDGLGRRLGMTHRSVPVLAPSRDAAEQEPRAWWEASCAALRELVGSGACFGRRIRGIALAGQMHGLVLLDRDGEPVRPAIIWLDNRSRNELRSWRERLGEGAVEGITGIPLSPGMLGPSLSWVARNEPSNYARAAVALLPKDYLGLRLTGVACTDPTDATGTLLFDAAARRWSNRIVQAVGLREALLPEVVETFAERGRVTPEAAEATGLPIGLPVICGGGDTALAALALDLAPDRVSIAVNTGGTVCTVSNSARMRPAAGLHTLCYARPDQWLLMQPILVAGEALIWHARVCFGTPELPAGAINTLLAEAATAPPGSDGLLFLPTLSGERTDPQGLGAFIGLRLAHTRASLTRAVLEGVAFELRGALETVIERETAAEIICSGGGFRSALWRQIQADVLGRPVTVVDEDQHSAIGAAWVACRGVLGPDVPAPRLSGHLLPPDDGRRVTYETAYALFRRAHADTRPISHAISLASGS